MKERNYINSYSAHKLRKDVITTKEHTWIFKNFNAQLEKSRELKNV